MGYLETGMTVALDNSQDALVVREAGVFWREPGMRAKTDSAVAEVNEEVNAGRLGWNVKDVQRVIRPYPNRARRLDLGAAGRRHVVPRMRAPIRG